MYAGYLAVAFSNGTISVFLTSTNDEDDNFLRPGRVFNLGANLSGMTVGGGSVLMIR
jgi:hypothetical protein